MKLWIYLIICVFGATMAGYFSGHYHGTRDAAADASRFSAEFRAETRVEEYLKESGSEKWVGKLNLLGSPRTYMQESRSNVKYMLIGLAAITGGLVGFVRTKRAMERRSNQPQPR